MTEAVLKLVDQPTTEALEQQARDNRQERATAAAVEVRRLQDLAVAARAAATTAADEYTTNLTNLVDDESAMRLRLRMEILRDRAEIAENNARASADEAAGLMREASRDLQRAELDGIRQQLSQRPCASQQNRLRVFLRAFRADARVALAELGEAVTASNRLRARAKDLSVSLGAPENFGVLSVDQAIGEVLADLEKESGDGDVTIVTLANSTGNRWGETFRVDLVGRVHGGQS